MSTLSISSTKSQRIMDAHRNFPRGLASMTIQRDLEANHNFPGGIPSPTDSENTLADIDYPADKKEPIENEEPTVEPTPEPTPYIPRWRRMIRNFTPNWFTVTMGTGITASLLHNLPYENSVATTMSFFFLALNVFLFVLFTILSILRYLMYHDCWRAMVHHPVQSLFLGCWPMGLSTIINMSIVSLSAPWGNTLIYTVWGLWWVNVATSILAAIFVPWMVMYRHNPGLQTITAALILPVVSTVVCAASGGLVALYLPSAAHRQLTIITAYILWGAGEYFCAIIICIYFHRLTLHSIPPRELIVSVFLPIGALGNGGFGIINLGLASLQTLPETGLLSSHFTGGPVDDASLVAGRVLYVVGIVVGIMMWGFGVVLLTFALIAIFTTKRFPFNMGWWAFTFPMGVLATCTGAIATQLDSTFFRVLTMALSLAVVSLWFVVAVKTVLLARRDLVAESFPEYPNWKKEFQPVR